MSNNDKIRHKGTPAEPFATPGAYGRITRTRDDGPLRITPAYRSIPAMAHCEWGEGADAYNTWERLADIQFVGKKK